MVGVKSELESHEDAFCCKMAPVLIFNEFRLDEISSTPNYLRQILKKDAPDSVYGGNWIGIRRFNLMTHIDTTVLDQSKINPPSPYNLGWINRIMSVSEDGNEAICSVGLSTGGKVDFSVFEVSFTEGLKNKIVDLPYGYL